MGVVSEVEGESPFLPSLPPLHFLASSIGTGGAGVGDPFVATMTWICPMTCTKGRKEDKGQGGRGGLGVTLIHE